MIVDLLYGEAKCLAHAEPAWLALPEAMRGRAIDRSDAHPALHPSRQRDRAVLVASSNDARAARRKGYQRIALLEHGIGQSYQGVVSSAYPGGQGRGMVGLFLSPNRTAAAKDRAAYPGARVEVVGCPRLDTLPARDRTDKTSLPGSSVGSVVAISFHWSKPNPPEMRSAFAHYRDSLPSLAERFTLIGHAHPMARRAVFPAYEQVGIEIVESFDEVCRRADVYVADNTSTLYEFASTGRPVVVLNAPWYRRDVSHGLRFWEAASVGPNVDGPDDLVEAIHAADAMGVTSQQAKALSVVYAHRKGAAKRAARAIERWLA